MEGIFLPFFHLFSFFQSHKVIPICELEMAYVMAKAEEDFCFPVITDEHHGAGGQMAEPGSTDRASAWAPASGLL